MKATDVTSLYEMCRKNGITIWIDGGWGVDALLGHQSRLHKDLDIAIQEKDVSNLSGASGKYDILLERRKGSKQRER
jgi:lincosamide nucleotidyltransferase A/C/D/E